jgi:predicted nucleotide-binding protein (sugar kinase/HSP70/actin superfamily)
MERDMNHFLSEGYEINEVLASALHSVRENYLLKVATEKNIGKTIFFQGATARNKALVAAFEQRLQRPILVSKFCHLTGALGTALILRDEKKPDTSFLGINFHKKSIPISSEVCEFCTNHCKISVAEVDGERVAYGFLCGRDYDTQNYVHKDSGAFDLLQERKRLSRFPKKTTSPVNKSNSVSDLVIGLPAAVHLVDDLHMWKMFFNLLGITTLSSEKYHQAKKAGKKLSQAEFCAPICSMHGHTQWLLDRADYVFMPLYLENKAKDARRQYCYYTQFLPALVTEITEEAQKRILRPVIKYLYTSFHTKMQLYQMLQRIAPGSWNFFEVVSAFDRAILFDQEYRSKLKKLYTERIAEKQGKDISVVFLGRPYTLFSPSLNCNIPKIFYNLGVDSFYQDMLSYDAKDVAPIADLLNEIHWEHATKILEAAEVIAKTKDVYPVLNAHPIPLRLNILNRLWTAMPGHTLSWNSMSMVRASAMKPGLKQRSVPLETTGNSGLDFCRLTTYLSIPAMPRISTRNMSFFPIGTESPAACSPPLCNVKDMTPACLKRRNKQSAKALSTIQDSAFP